MKITVAHLSKDRLSTLPQDERVALLLVGHVLNELTVLHKLYHASQNPLKEATRVERDAQAIQTMILMRTLLGKSVEAWDLYRSKIAPLVKRVGSSLPPEYYVAVKKINVEFNDPRLTRIRNNVAFHYKDQHDLIEQHWSDVDFATAGYYYLSELNLNSLYLASEVVVTEVLAQLSGEKWVQSDMSNDRAQFGFSEAVKLAGEIPVEIIYVMNRFMTLIIEKNMPDIFGEQVEIGRGAKHDEITLSFYWDEADFKENWRHPLNPSPRTPDNSRPYHLRATTYPSADHTKAP